MNITTTLDEQALLNLAGWETAPIISLFMPTHRSGSGTREDPIRFKNLLKEAEKQLTEQDWADDGRNLLLPAHDLLEQNDVWRHASDGMALMLSPSDRFAWQVPVAFREHVFVGDQPWIRPLIDVLSMQRTFFILAASENDVRLLKADSMGFERVEAEKFPKNLRDALGHETWERELQFHTGAPPTGRAGEGRASVFHGQGVGDQAEEANLTRFLRAIDRGVSDALKGETAPLILATVEEMASKYARISTYKYLSKKPLEGNVDHLPDKDLWERVLDQADGLMDAPGGQALEALGDARSDAKASHDIRTITAKAYQGGVATLLLTDADEVWGRYDPDRDETVLSGHQAKPNDAAIQTLKHGGKTVGVGRDALPEQSPVAAVLRF